MAVRIHVTAAQGCPADEVRTIFTEMLGPNFGEVTVHEQGEWTWFRTSVWGVSAQKLNEGLCQLARPGLQFTTSDGDRWILTVHGGAQGREHFLHEFGYSSRPADPEKDEVEDGDFEDEDAWIDPDLAFLEDAPEGPKRPRRPIDRISEGFAEMGCPLPESLVEELRELSYCEAVNELRERLADGVIASIEGSGISVDAPSVRKVLLWEGVTERERDSDLGNLPRLLKVLGLGGEWDDYIRQAEEFQAGAAERGDDEEWTEDEPEPEAPAPDHARQVLDLVDDLPMVVIEGGPVPIAATKLVRLGFPSEACSTGNSPGMAVLFDLPADAAPFEPTQSPENRFQVVVDSAEGRVRLGLLSRMWFNRSNLEDQGGASLVEFLKRPPEGTAIEVNFAVDGEPATYHRFRGTVRKGKLRVDKAYPAITRAVLADAIRLAGPKSRSKVRCHDEAEAESLVQAARRSNGLHGMGVRRKGTLVGSEDLLGALPLLLLRLRYPDAWDFGPWWEHDKKQCEERVEMERRLRRSSAEIARKRAAPHDPEPLLKGEHTWYFRSDFSRFDELDAEPRARFDAAMGKLGFTHVGDLVAKVQRDIMLRVFQSADELCYGVLMGKRTMYLGFEFVSRLEDGSGLTTTTNAAMESVPQAGIYFRNFPGLEPEALLARHQQGLNRFREHKKVGPVVLGATLADVAREIEIAFGRQKMANQLEEDDEEEDD